MSQEAGMTTMTSQPVHFAGSRRRSVTTAVLVVLFWIAAAILVVAAHVELEPRSPVAAAVATIAAIGVTACAYTWLTAPRGGTSHALGVGIAWLVLSIAAEMYLTHRVGHAWFTLLGSPERPLLRNIYLFVWIFAPALFSRRDEEPS
jgi:hypothetical protein